MRPRVTQKIETKNVYLYVYSVKVSKNHNVNTIFFTEETFAKFESASVEWAEQLLFTLIFVKFQIIEGNISRFTKGISILHVAGNCISFVASLTCLMKQNRIWNDKHPSKVSALDFAGWVYKLQ